MRKIKMIPILTVFFALLAFFLCLPAVTYAHCDGLDGPVVMAVTKALETGKVNPVLIWVQKKDEQTIKDAFSKTLASQA